MYGRGQKVLWTIEISGYESSARFKHSRVPRKKRTYNVASTPLSSLSFAWGKVMLSLTQDNGQPFGVGGQGFLLPLSEWERTRATSDKPCPWTTLIQARNSIINQKTTRKRWVCSLAKLPRLDTSKLLGLGVMSASPSLHDFVWRHGHRGQCNCYDRLVGEATKTVSDVKFIYTEDFKRE